MSRIENHGKPSTRAILLAAMLTAASLLPAHAQYVGRVDSNSPDNTAPILRATAVLEYTGDLAKPTASRLVPIAVWDGERYQPGGLYLAQPVPLTVEAGTQYVLQVAGTPKALFDVKAASDVGGSWIAIGSFQKPDAPHAAKLRPSRHLPRIINDANDDKPHFAHVPSGDSNPGSGSTTSSSPNNAPPVDPDRPTLHRRTDDGCTQSTSSGNSGTNTAPSSNTASNSAPVDPDRPILHEPTASTSASASANTPDGQAPETATSATDPNRPHLEYGRPAELESLDTSSAVIAKLSSHPDDLEEIAAISDAKTREPRSYVYSWTDPEDEKKMQTALETAAQQLLAKSSQSTPKTTSSSTTRRTATRRAAAPALPALTDEQFKAYELSFGGGATLIFTATSGEGDAAKYITLIAQPDFKGTPLILFKQITKQRDLDITPRMKLIDAVDTDADNRAELIFALENSTGRQYAIYRVANNTVEQVFSTGS